MTKPVDLDALLGEREPRQMKFGGRVWTLPPELPPVALEYLRNGRIEEGCCVLVGDEDGPDLARYMDMDSFMYIITEVFGIDPEALASSATSSNTGGPPRPTSKRTTASRSTRR